VGYQEDA
jgi:hypothetical protein